MLPHFDCLDVQAKRRFDRCWLAATNPAFFRQTTATRADVQVFDISKMCDEIKEKIERNLTSNRNHISLRVVANLMYGTIRIFREQVDLLLDDTRRLMNAQNITWAVPLPSRKRANSKPMKKGAPKVKRVTAGNDSLDFTLDQLRTGSEQLVLTDKEIAILGDTNNNYNQRSDLISLREPPEHEQNDLWARDDFNGIEDFGEMNWEERESFLNLIGKKPIALPEAVDAELFNETLETTQEFLPFDDVTYSVPSSSKVNFSAATKNDSLPCSTYPAVDDNDKALNNNETEAFKKPATVTVMSRKRKADDDESDDELSAKKFMENIQRSSTPISMLSNNNKFFSNCSNNVHIPLEKLADQPKRHKQPERKLKIDEITIISRSRFLRQFESKQTLRATSPIHDIVPLFEMKRVSSVELLKTPARRIYSSKLTPHFRRNTNVKKVNYDGNIINKILNLPLIDVQVEPAKRIVAMATIENRLQQNRNEIIAENTATNLRTNSEPEEIIETVQPASVIEKN